MWALPAPGETRKRSRVEAPRMPGSLDLGGAGAALLADEAAHRVVEPGHRVFELRPGDGLVRRVLGVLLRGLALRGISLVRELERRVEQRSDPPHIGEQALALGLG